MVFMPKLQLPSFTTTSLNHEQRYDRFGEYNQQLIIQGKQSKEGLMANEQVGARARIDRAPIP